MDYFQSIEHFYPRRDLSAPTLQCQRTYKAIKKGFGKHLIDVLNKNPLPLVCTFFIPVILAEGHGYKGKIYCLCTDTDISRAWVPFNSKESRIIYLAPTVKVKDRLLLYGVKPNNIIVTGFPLPSENTEGNILRLSLIRRLKQLDPNGVFREKYQSLVYHHLKNRLSAPVSEPLTITFAVGGAGAQWKIGVEILRSLKKMISEKKVKLNLVAGTSSVVLKYFTQALNDLGLVGQGSSGVEIIYAENKFSYFRKFNSILNETDLLWTKPSELSFYAGLGLPIIIAPTLGSQERANRSWLRLLDAGFDEQDPCYTHEWLPDLLKTGCLARAAFNGYLVASHDSSDRIKGLVLNGKLDDIKNIFL